MRSSNKITIFLLKKYEQEMCINYDEIKNNNSTYLFVLLLLFVESATTKTHFVVKIVF